MTLDVEKSEIVRGYAAGAVRGCYKGLLEDTAIGDAVAAEVVTREEVEAALAELARRLYCTPDGDSHRPARSRSDD